MPAFIDTASTLSYLREDVVRVIGTQLNATVDAENNYWVDCRLRKQDGTVNFGFKRGNLKTLITVSYRNFIWETGGRCLMGIQPAEPGTAAYVLGDTFIRGAYCESLPCLGLAVRWRADMECSGLRSAVGRRVDGRLLQLRGRHRQGRRPAARHGNRHRSVLTW